MPLRDPSAELVEEVNTLFPELRTYAISCFRHLGCPYPESCGTDAVTECLIPPKPKKKRPGEKKPGNGRRVSVSDGLIKFYDPRAQDQRKYLFGRVKLKVRSKHYNCSVCEHAATCEVAEDSQFAGEDEPRARRAVPVSPMNPEDFAIRNQTLAQAHAAMTSDEQRRALDLLIAGYSREEIARLLNQKPATVRQWISRARRKLRRLLGINTRPRRK